MSDIKFDDVDELKRERDIEGEIGVFLRITDHIFLKVLCQSDANPRYRELGPKRFKELRRQANAKATPEDLTARWAELFTDWKQWAEAAGEFIGTQRRFSDLLITRGLEKWRNSMGVRGFQGIGLKQPHTPAYTPYSDN